MRNFRTLFALAVLSGICAAPAQANWMTFTGGPAVALGTWPGGSGLAGFATVTASNFVNGNPATPAIGLTPITVGPPLSADFFAAGLMPNAGNTVPMIGTPYNDAGDMYHVVIDFSGTVGGSSVGVLPAGTLFALIDLDIQEDYRRITATNAANVQITHAVDSWPERLLRHDAADDSARLAGSQSHARRTGGRRLRHVWRQLQLRRRHVVVHDHAGRQDHCRSTWRRAPAATPSAAAAPVGHFTSPIPEPSAVALAGMFWH